MMIRKRLSQTKPQFGCYPLFVILLSILILTTLVLLHITRSSSGNNRSEDSGPDGPSELSGRYTPQTFTLRELTIPYKVNNHLRHPSETPSFPSGREQIWDPHPQYMFRAFNRDFHLVLSLNTEFLVPDVHVYHITENSTWRAPSAPYIHCFYSGYLLGDIHSVVGISLCKGMLGHIRTRDASYFIEPTRGERNDSSPHLITKHPHPFTGGTLPSSHGFLSQDDKFEMRTFSEKNSRRKRSTSHNYSVEILVVADRKMSQYHGSELKHYILTLMSVVALLYRDSSIGNSINIAVVRIFLEESRFNFRHSQDSYVRHSASQILSDFCKWQKDNNFPDDHPQHHDTALLLTREDICRNPTLQKCDTLGLAELGTICDSGSSCSIVQDNGLSAAFTIAHEIGHSLNMPHDDDHKCQRFKEGESRNQNVMSRMLDHNTYPWSWSSCSRHYVTEFLDAGYGGCLLDEPEMNSLTSGPNQSPGQQFDENRQCELVFGNGSRICSYMPKCKRLWCTTDKGEQEGCRTQHMPWADGTPCGDQMWCQRGECILKDQNRIPVDGNWSKWEDDGGCSRTCGGGVKRQVRKCNNPKPANGGKYCTGERLKFYPCNITPCPSESDDFRLQQCETFNNNNFNINYLPSNVKWKPKYSGILPKDQCKLFCEVVGSTAYYLLSEKVVDGTPCNPNTFDMCVNGMCRPAGCDRALHSKKKSDMCGVCGGDGSTCQPIAGSFNKSHYGYNDVVTLPIGAANVYITQRGIGNSNDDDNYLALYDPDEKKNILNGNYVVTMFERTIRYGGTTLYYSGSGAVVETINFTLPLKKELVVQVLSVGVINPPDIHYKYTISTRDIDQFFWKTWDDAECSSICHGSKNRKSVCIFRQDNTRVDDYNCKAGKPPDEVIPCNNFCILSWEVAFYGECKSECGEGTKEVTVRCTQVFVGSNERRVVADHHCLHIAKPNVEEPCRRECKNPRWTYFDWSQCSVSCGVGIQRREVTCRTEDDRDISLHYCSEQPKDVEIKECKTSECPKWEAGEWTECSVTCGNGTRSRNVSCRSGSHRVDMSYCDHMEVPDSRESCHSFCSLDPDQQSYQVNDHPNSISRLDHLLYKQPGSKACVMNCDAYYADCKESGNCDNVISPWNSPRCCFEWIAEEWNECDRTCGQGYKIRKVYCKSTTDNKTVEDSSCGKHKPASRRKCAGLPRCIHSSQQIVNIEHKNAIGNYKWQIGQWGKCSKTCDGGFKQRLVVCQTEDGKPSDQCDEKKRPYPTVHCNTDPCPKWNTGDWSPCSQTCGGGVQQRQVRCQDHLGRTMPDHQCDMLKRPESTEECDSPKCPQSQTDRYRWVKGKWSPCSKTCGKGIKLRSVICAENGDYRVQVPDSMCKYTKPKTERSCSLRPCPFEWKVTPWSECVPKCGLGIQHRLVTCHRVNIFNWVDPEPVSVGCDEGTKPKVVQQCFNGDCDKKYYWKTWPWKRCQADCGQKGKQRRRVKCVDQNKRKVPRKYCAGLKQPRKKRSCERRPCGYLTCSEVQKSLRVFQNAEYQLLVGHKNVSIYCHGMNTSSPTEYVTLAAGEEENYSEIYDKRLLRPDTCPFGGSRKENCECILDAKRRAGITMFSRIRLNVTSLRVNTHDFVYSRQIKGQPISLGEAGDCYSAATNCPQGRFSINVSGTGFKIDRRTVWVGKGHKPSIFIETMNGEIARGKCGGYCGACSPDFYHGLKLEVTP